MKATECFVDEPYLLQLIRVSETLILVDGTPQQVKRKAGKILDFPFTPPLPMLLRDQAHT